ncbi:hypothetical protein E2C01_026835 [Portunus trituberculatus]|uniref:Uncharacterized protein n=1 Tax=Portunus trituberculatus TaxID=210409 RepID=A0A5B7EKB8_PORTR|nr:hypothetical protein [Portunus trituberculatus]
MKFIPYDSLEHPHRSHSEEADDLDATAPPVALCYAPPPAGPPSQGNGAPWISDTHVQNLFVE